MKKDLIPVHFTNFRNEKDVLYFYGRQDAEKALLERRNRLATLTGQYDWQDKSEIRRLDCEIKAIEEDFLQSISVEWQQEAVA